MCKTKCLILRESKTWGQVKILSVTFFFYDILKILECVFKQVPLNIPVLLSVQIKDIKTFSFEKTK